MYLYMYITCTLYCVCVCVCVCVCRPVGSKFQLVRRGSNKACEVHSLGGPGGMPSQENFAL